MAELQIGQEIAERVRGILAAQAFLEIQDVADVKSLEELGLDSMGLVEVIFAIEEAFDIQIPYNANAPEAPGFDISSVGAIIAAVEGLVAAQQD